MFFNCIKIAQHHQKGSIGRYDRDKRNIKLKPCQSIRQGCIRGWGASVLLTFADAKIEKKYPNLQKIGKISSVCG